MATRLAWWTIPATVVVLVRVVTLPSSAATNVEPEPRAAPTVASAVADGVTGSQTVVLRDASGLRSGPIEWSRSDALILELPVASRRVDFVLRRYLAPDGAPSLWLHGNPQVAADGVMRLAGLPTGRYAAEIEWTEDGQLRRIERSDLAVPGTFDLRQ